MSVNRNNKLVLLHEKIERRSAGDIIYRTYACPCGRGTIEEEQDYTEGHRDGIAFLKCKFCEDRYFIDFGNSEINWKISERNIPSAITGRKNKTNFIGGKKMITTLDDFTREYTKIKAMGWVKTHRSGPTGIGKTLEDLLGIVENNIDGPDFGDYELKSCRLNSNSMLTIFTKTPQPQGAASTLRMKFGYSSEAYDNDEKVLHSTLSADRFVSIASTGHSLKVSCDETKISIVAEDGREYAYWTRDQLKKAFEKKYKGKFVYAKAQSRGNGESEEFSFIEAYEVSGFNYDAFVNLLEQGKIYIDLRIGQYHGGAKDGQTHDHGTGFRIKENDQHLLFRVNRRIV